jgi:hypothetical protein
VINIIPQKAHQVPIGEEVGWIPTGGLDAVEKIKFFTLQGFEL